MVFWTYTIENRGTGWLNEKFHHAFREFTLHAASREDLICPIYTLLPDHLHLVLMGISPESDQRRATAFLRQNLEPLLSPRRFQHQPYDHVLDENERRRNAFAKTCEYIASNPVRAGLTQAPPEWLFTGSIFAGYPDLHPCAPGFREKFWRLYNKTRGKRIEPSPS